jgi:chromosome segregation ATPase
MSEISEYETRITAALERIGRAVATVEEQAPAAAGGIATEEMMAEMGRLQEALETERDTNAQLEERVKAIHQTQQSHVASLEEEVETLRNQLMVHDGETQKLRRVNVQLRDNNQALRDANMQAMADPALVNTALMNELEALKAGREADMAELGAIRDELRPIIEAAAPRATEEA